MNPFDVWEVPKFETYAIIKGGSNNLHILLPISVWPRKIEALELVMQWPVFWTARYIDWDLGKGYSFCFNLVFPEKSWVNESKRRDHPNPESWEYPHLFVQPEPSKQQNASCSSQAPLWLLPSRPDCYANHVQHHCESGGWGYDRGHLVGFWPIFLMVRNVFEILDQRTRSSSSIFCG